MRRHQPPTLVSMWMLDVFCCALGCVTLLWLLKTREAGEISEEALQAAALVRKPAASSKIPKRSPPFAWPMPSARR